MTREIPRETMRLQMRERDATLVLSRPEVLNCINEPWLRDLQASLDDVERSETIRVLLVRGAGRAFCSGLDLTALSQDEIGTSFFTGWEVAMRRIETMAPIVVAAIHSHCIGGGLQLALACDLKIARRDARLAITAVNEGIIPGMGMWRLARHAGLGRARRLALAADVVDAETALQWGLVDYVEGPDDFEPRIEALVSRLAEGASEASRLTKKLITAAFDASWSDALEIFAEYQRLALASPEHQQAMVRRRARRRTTVEPQSR